MFQLAGVLRIALLIVYCEAALGWGIGPADQPQQQMDRGNLPCPLILTPFTLHLTTYLAPGGAPAGSAALDRHCHDVPSTGRIHFTLDLLDRVLRTVPIAIAVVTGDQTGEGDTDPAGATILSVPAQRHPHGYLEGEVDIETPGHYTIVVDVQDLNAERRRARLPLRVAVRSWVDTAATAGALLILLVAAGLIARLRRLG